MTQRDGCAVGKQQRHEKGTTVREQLRKRNKTKNIGGQEEDKIEEKYDKERMRRAGNL